MIARGIKTERIMVQLPKPLAEDVKNIAKANCMSVSAVIRFIIAKELNNMAKGQQNQNDDEQ